MYMKKINKKKGILFWITGLSGSGKTNISKKIHKQITKKYGPTICISGDEIRKIFNLKGFNKVERLNIAKKYVNLINLTVKQNVNVIISVVGLFHELHKINRLKFKNYLEIYIKSNLKKIKKRRNKFFYRRKTKNVWGLDIKPEFPKNPHIIISNNFKRDLNDLSKELILKIDKRLKL